MIAATYALVKVPPLQMNSQGLRAAPCGALLGGPGNQCCKCRLTGGGSEIRTRGEFTPTSVFKTGALNRSAIPPCLHLEGWVRLQARNLVPARSQR